MTYEANILSFCPYSLFMNFFIVLYRLQFIVIKAYFVIFTRTTRMGGSSHGTHSVVPFRNFEEEMKRPRVWEAEQGSSASIINKTQDNLASLYRPPFALMFHGPFEKVCNVGI